MFDTITGLPVHALALHAVVVLLPLMAVVTFAVALRPAWRGGARWVVIADAAVLVAAVVTKLSGEALQARLSAQLPAGQLIADTHGREGSWIPAVALGVLLAAAVVWLGNRRPGLVIPAIVLAAVAGVIAVGWTVIVGDSGARAVWEGVVKSTQAP